MSTTKYVVWSCQSCSATRGASPRGAKLFAAREFGILFSPVIILSKFVNTFGVKMLTTIADCAMGRDCFSRLKGFSFVHLVKVRCNHTNIFGMRLKSNLSLIVIGNLCLLLYKHSKRNCRH